MGKRICSFMGLAAVLATVAACSGKPEPAEVVISLDEAVQPLTSATVIVDYSGAAAKPQIAGGEPACFVLPPDVTGEFSDDGAGHLTIEVKARRAFAAPIDLAVCRMIPDSKDVAAATISARLKVALSGATDTKGEKLDDRRLAMTRSGGRDVTSAAPGTAAAPGAASDSGMKVDRESMGSGGNSGAAGAGSGASSEAGSLGEALRNRNTGNPAKEMEREAERVKRETQKAERAERAANGSGTGNAGNSTDAGDLGGTADPDAENDPGVSRATPSYDVTVEIMNNAGLIGALQFDLNHSGNSGGWQGAGGGVRCSWNVSGGITACNDVGSGRARCALADISGFQTPASIVTCTFKTDEAVSASDFNVQVIDSSTPDFDPATVNMAVTSVVQR
jgi:hypothetical protein